MKLIPALSLVWESQGIPFEFPLDSGNPVGRNFHCNPRKCMRISHSDLRESVVSGSNFCSNPRSVKSVKYLKLLFILLGSILVAAERHIFKLTKGCLISEKIEPK